ncbi:MAG: Eco57I restriction-modification methylase domain-containing protein [Promethearchaeota archaeon]
MASKGALLRNIRLSGGLFTENIILRLRENPEKLDIGKISSFIKKKTKEEIKKFTEKRRKIFEWCKDKWDEISLKIEDFSLEDLTQKWLIPFLSQFKHELEEFKINPENIDEDNPIFQFRILYQSKNHKNPFFHFVTAKEDLDEKSNKNPKNNSHHNTCQQFINFNHEINWLFLSNGKILRILTKYYHTYSKGFIEFDLENIFSNRDEKEFNVLYSLIHKTRYIPMTNAEEKISMIEELQKTSISEGVKVGDSLRDNVKNAIELLGDQLIQQNTNFKRTINKDTFDVMQYYAELLRIIYRIIFILYAEQREMLPGAGSIYFEEFSISKLRKLVEKPIKADNNIDLWEKIFITFELVQNGNDLLDINAFNGSLFDNQNLPIIFGNKLKLSNEILLKIIRELTTTTIDNIRQRINFLEIQEEEIGAIYESLLDFKPVINDQLRFYLAAGTERKSTGTYYTPKELIDILIKTTLKRVVEDKLAKAGNSTKDKENAILDIKVCDPACGGGTFLLATMDYLGKILAEIRTGKNDPLEDYLRDARRDVLQHCIYGVDLNPLAVELAKISLWLRAAVKDKPLNFLDNHIKCGNSLVGLGQKKKIKRFDPEAYTAIKGNKQIGKDLENRKMQNMARKIIRNENRTFDAEIKTSFITNYLFDKKTADICSIKFNEIINKPEDSPIMIKEKKEKYYQLRKNEIYQLILNEANLWTSAYFWPLEGNTLGKIPNYTIIEHLRSKRINNDIFNLIEKVNQLSNNYKFFHWYIEFPEVFSDERKGFDCILTNPPWESIELKEREYFIGLNNTIVNAPNQAERRKLIKKLKTEDPILFNKYRIEWIKMKKLSHFLRKSGLYKLSAKGTLNTYALFAERCWNLISPHGYIGIICPTGIITEINKKDLFINFINEKSLTCIFDFDNKNIFDIHKSYKFCLISICGKNIFYEKIPMMFFVVDPLEIQYYLPLIENKQILQSLYNKEPDNSRLIIFHQKDFKLFNPNTLTCPLFKIKKEVKLFKQIYKQTQTLIKKDPSTNKILSNSWDLKNFRMFGSASDSKLFYDIKKLRKLGAEPLNPEVIGGKWGDDKNIYIPLYEGKMIWLYDHRFNNSSLGKKMQHKSIPVSLEQHQNVLYEAVPAYWIKESDLNKKLKIKENKWYICFRDTARSEDQRTLISTIIPNVGFTDTLTGLISYKKMKKLYLLLANLNSIIIDFVVRKKISGAHVKSYIIEQLPIFPPSRYNNKLSKIIKDYVLRLVYTSYSLKDFAKDLGYNSKPFTWDPEERAQMMADLDAIYAHLYKINREDLKYILNTFTVLRKKEKEKYGEFRTERLVLEAYDKFKNQKELFKNE